MFKFREEIKTILGMDIEDYDKLDKIAEVATTTTDATRVISVREDEGLKWLDKIGERVTGIGRHWADVNGDHLLSSAFENETQKEVEVVFFVNDVKGYKVQYFGEKAMGSLFEDEDAMYEFIDKMEEDEVYQEIMDLIGSDADMENEQEFIISNNTEFIVDNVYDARNEEGFIVVNLIAK